MPATPDLDWFSRGRYGMFIHWGPYAVAGRGEWVANRECIPFEEYRDRYASRFLAEKYDPRTWAKLARAAGMAYVVLTTRHHDGFCLWPTRTTPFNAANLGPRRDLIAPYVEAMREAGLKVGFYYSVADWFHPDYPGAYCRDWPTAWRDEASRQRFVAFYRAQLEELMTQYGRIDLLWYDGCIPRPTDGEAVNQRIKELQPHILINERNGEPFDFRCSEQTIKAKEGPWEACMTLNDNWGYHAGDDNWKQPRDVARMLVSTAKSAGNLLINVGPRADGTIPVASERILLETGEWIARHREFLPDSTRSPFGWTNTAVLTTRGNVIYAHLFVPVGIELCLADIGNSVRRVRDVGSGRDLPFERSGPRLFIRDMPFKDPIATVLAIEVDGEPTPNQTQETFWIPE